MKKDIKHYFIVGAILCGIGAGSALLLGLTNFGTKDKIAQNAIAAQKESLKEIYELSDEEFGLENFITTKADYKKEELEALEKEGKKPYTIDKSLIDKYTNIISFWKPTATGDYGYIFKTEGKDAAGYGEIQMLVEIKTNGKAGKISLISNTESFGYVVQGSYVDLINIGSKDIYDIKCGATYGATLVRDMSIQAEKFVKEVLK